MIKKPKDFATFVREKLQLTALALVFIFTAAGLLTIYAEQELVLLATQISEQMGFIPLALILFVSDTVLSPFPPDLILFVVAKGPFRENWPVYVGILGFLSTLGGITGWYLIRIVGEIHWIERKTTQFRQKYQGLIERYGMWFVVLGALTPVPFSVTCWTAGILGIPFKRMAFACLFRIPRFYIAYLVMHYSDHFAFLGEFMGELWRKL